MREPSMQPRFTFRLRSPQILFTEIYTECETYISCQRFHRKLGTPCLFEHSLHVLVNIFRNSYRLKFFIERTFPLNKILFIFRAGSIK